MNLKRNDEVTIEEADNSIDIKKEPNTWRFWATFGFSAAVILLFFISQVLISTFIIIIYKLKDPNLQVSAFESNGVVISFCVLGSGIISSALLLFFGFLKKGIGLRDYFHLYPVSFKQLLLWLGIMSGVIVFFDVIAYFVKGQIVPEVMHAQYETVGFFLPVMLVAFILIAPIFEELVFRAFIFDSIRKTAVGSIGAVIITSLLWSIIHFQYDLFGVGIIFFFGIMLGVARLKTNSLYTTILMHSAMNVIATTECIIINEFLR